jgi:3-oxoacyl-[acyl-carrier protein] reductase
LLGATQAAVVKTMTGNTWPAIQLVQTAMAAGLASDGGAVLNISTIGAQQTQPLAGLYVAAKAALESLTRALAHELAPHCVRVNAIAPGVVRTQTSAVLWQGEKSAAESRLVPLGRLGEPEDIAPAAAFLLSNEASWITGATLVIDGGRMLVGGERADLIGTPPPDPQD